MKLPFEYKADVVPAGKRTPITRRFMEWCEVEIQSVSSAEAPIAARWQETHKIKRAEYARALRHYNDGFYAPADEFSMKGILSIENKDDESWITDRTHPMISDELLKSIAADKLYGGGEQHPSDFRHQQNNRREEYLDRFMKNVNRHIFIDGDLWARVYEPILVLSIMPIGSHDIAVIKIEQFEDVDLMARLDSKDASNYFRFSFAELDALEDFIALRSQEYDAAYFQRQDQFKSLEVLIPDAFRIDLCSKDCLAFAELLVSSAHELQKQDTNTIRRFADLKDAFDAEIQSPSPEASEALMSALGNYSERAGDFYNGISQALVERHAMRPISSIGLRI
jgi:hypothetical protein